MLACNLIRASNARQDSIARARPNSVNQTVAPMVVISALQHNTVSQAHLLKQTVTLASIALTGVHLVLKNVAMLATTAP